MVAVTNPGFENSLIGSLAKIKGFGPHIVIEAGAANLQRVVKPILVVPVQQTYNTALTQLWYLSAVLACISIFGSFFVK